MYIIGSEDSVRNFILASRPPFSIRRTHLRW